MKKRIISLLAIFSIVSMLAGCGTGGNQNSSSKSSSARSSKADNSQASESKTESVAKKTTPKVYMTKKITPEGLVNVYKALERKATGKVAIKLTVGEPGDTYYLNPSLIKNLVLSVKGTFVDCDTAYGGGRADTAMHKQVAKDHGFTDYASFDVMDADGTMVLPAKGGKHIQKDTVGSHYNNYDSIIVLSHFKGHEMAGFGGAIKNMSIGIASEKGKVWIHSAGTSVMNGTLASTPDFQESMAEAAKAVADNRGDHILYISVMNNLSIDCDCVANPAKPEMKDIGILASIDPVALDKACVDLVYKAPDSKALRARIESLNGTHTLEYAEKIGLGSQTYQLVNIDG